jgi:ubiquinone/menaquinone biosynthesis C-methylase UbiE
MRPSRPFLPAAGVDWLLPLYDPLVSLLGFGSARSKLLDLAAPQPSDRILDIGCGTGTFAVNVKQKFPAVHVTGLDPDAKALVRAKQKAADASTDIEFLQGFSDELPLPDKEVDIVFSSFMFHHLPPDVQIGTVKEVRRVLKPGGLFLLLDLGGPGSEGHSFMDHIFHSGNNLEHNSEEDVLGLLRSAGFGTAAKVADTKLFFGLVRVNYFRAAA